MRIYGSASRAGIGGDGIDIPLEPPAISAQLAAARLARQAQFQAAAEDRATPPPPARQRSRSAETLSLPSTMQPRPAPRVAAPLPVPVPVPEPEIVPEAEQTTPDAPVSCAVCGLQVAPEYIKRTGERRHWICRDGKPVTIAPRPARRVRRAGQLVGAAGRGDQA